MKKDNNRKDFKKGAGKGNYKRVEKKRDFTFDDQPKKSRYPSGGSSDRPNKGDASDKRKYSPEGEKKEGFGFKNNREDYSRPSSRTSDSGYGQKRFDSKPEEKKRFSSKSKDTGYPKKKFENNSKDSGYPKKRFEDKSGFGPGRRKDSGDDADFPKKNYNQDKDNSYKGKKSFNKPFEKRTDGNRNADHLSRQGSFSRFDQEKPRSTDSYTDKGRKTERREGTFKSERKGAPADNLPLEDSRLIYKGRGKDEKPVFARAPKEDKSTSPGIGKYKNNPYAQEPLDERPDYNFDKIEKKHKKNEDSDILRLNKFISNSGICSRREADLLIEKGEIQVNGEVIREMGFKVQRKDRVTYKGRQINPEKPVYILLNKPKDFITTTEDPEDRKTVMHLIKNACEERVFPVGRLDRNTTGLLLFTNDGELASKLSHPSNKIKKIYQVTLDKPLSKNDEEAILGGLTLEDGPVEVDDMQVLSKDRTIIGLEIHAGRNRIVRRIFAHVGYEVVALDRVVYAGLDKKDLPRGRFRFLSEKEVIKLKYF
jgi:23S rRNA pseudouridine2605 synthase